MEARLQAVVMGEGGGRKQLNHRKYDCSINSHINAISVSNYMVTVALLLKEHILMHNGGN